MRLQRGEILLHGFQAGIHGSFIGDAQAHPTEERRRVKGTELSLPFLGALSQCLLGLVLKLGFDAIDLGHRRLKLAHSALVLGADDFFDDPVEHGEMRYAARHTLAGSVGGGRMWRKSANAQGLKRALSPKNRILHPARNHGISHHFRLHAA